MSDSIKFVNRKVVIFGGLGFIGSNLAHRLVGLGADVTVVDSMLDQFGGNLTNITGIDQSLHINFSDIRDTHSLKYLVKGADLIFSMAGQTSHVESMTDPYTDLDINCRSQLSILETCRHHNPSAEIVYASTRQIYGRPQYLPVDEKHPILPVDVNGINKYAAEMYYRLYHEAYGMRCSSLRLTNTYGPRQHLRDDKQGFAGLFFRLALNGDTITVFGDGKQVRDFNYIDDVVDAFLFSVGREELYGQALNLGHPNCYSLRQFVELLSTYAEFELAFKPFPQAHKVIDIGDFYADYGAFQRLTGWEPKIDLPEGMSRTISYFKEHGEAYW